MGLLERASFNSKQRGYEYYKNNKVLSFAQVSDHEYEATVTGNGETPYKVSIDTEHTTKSKCNCPHADGRRIVCKHMIAVYFTAFPEMAREFERQVREAQIEREIAEASIREYERERRQKIAEYVNGLSVKELRKMLIEAMMKRGAFEDDENEYDDYDSDCGEDEEEYW